MVSDNGDAAVSGLGEGVCLASWALSHLSTALAVHEMTKRGRKDLERKTLRDKPSASGNSWHIGHHHHHKTGLQRLFHTPTSNLRVSWGWRQRAWGQWSQTQSEWAAAAAVASGIWLLVGSWGSLAVSPVFTWLHGGAGNLISVGTRPWSATAQSLWRSMASQSCSEDTLLSGPRRPESRQRQLCPIITE